MHPETRRIACDRCRGQKLRCVRPNQAGGIATPCERCLKTGAECTTSVSHAQRKVLLEAQQSQLQPSSRFYESITVPSIEALPVKRKSSQLFFDRSTAQNYHYSSMHFGHGLSEPEPQTDTPNAASDQIQNAAKMRQPLDFGAETLDFGLQLNAEIVHNHIGDDFMNMPFEGPSATPHETSAEFNEDDISKTTASTSRPWGTLEDCVHCLSELSSQILRDSHKMRSMSLQEILSFSAWPDNRKGQAQPGLQNSIGRLLDLTQAFLNILHYLKLALTTTPSSIPTAQPQSSFPPFHPQQKEHPSPSAPNNSEGSYSEFWVEPDSLTTTPNTRSTPQISSRMPTGPSTGKVDMPTTLTILTCYTWLLHAYGTFFHCIRAALSTNHSSVTPPLNTSPSFSILSSPNPDHPLHTSRLPSASTFPSANKLPAQHIPLMLPGLQIGGFDLNGHRDVQLDIILHLSSKMLGRIERLLGISLVSSQPRSGSSSTEDMWTDGSGMSRGEGGDVPILDSESASTLLEVMLKQDNLGYFKEVNGGATSVKQTVQEIRERLNTLM